MSKIRTNVSINRKVWEKAREHEINVSNFLEIKLREYIALIEGSLKDENTSKNMERPGRNLNPSPKLDRLG